MTAAANVTPRPSLTDHLLSWWFALPAPRDDPDATATREEILCDLRAAMHLASIHHVGALSAGYAECIIDRYSGRMGERG